MLRMAMHCAIAADHMPQWAGRDLGEIPRHENRTLQYAEPPLGPEGRRRSLGARRYRNELRGTTARALAADDLRAAILNIPGVGKGGPPFAWWQKVGEMCLGATKENVKEGEFKGVELSFMGLNNQNVHNVLFRGLSKAWADLYRCDHQLDRPGAGRLQCPPAAGDRHRHGRFRHRGNGHPSRATSAARAWLPRCRTGSRSRSIWTTMWAT